MTLNTRPVASANGDSGEEMTCHLTVAGMDCADCAKTIEASLAAMPGGPHRQSQLWRWHGERLL